MTLAWRYRALSCLRYFPRFRGKTRLGNFAMRWMRDEHGGIVTGKDGLVYQMPSIREPIAREMLIHGDYEPETASFLQEVLSNGDTFVDIGSNVGAFAIPASRWVGGAGRVIAIEASSRVYACLKSNVERNHAKNVESVHAALTCQDGGTVSFFDPPADRFGMGSIALWPGVEGYEVPARTLDAVLDELEVPLVKAIKIDVEGFEADVFAGAERTLLGNSPPIILFEYMDWAEKRAGKSLAAAQQFLLNRGYQIWRLADALAGRKPLSRTLTSGSDMLVARK